MPSMHIDAVLSQIRSIQAQVRAVAAAPDAIAQPATQSLAKVLQPGVDQINTQQRAAALATPLELGVAAVQRSAVMLEMQKASVSFQAVTEVSNRFINAYQEIMNMPI